MKYYSFRSSFLYVLFLLTCLGSCKCSKEKSGFVPIRSDEPVQHDANSERYRANEILVLYKQGSSAERKQRITDALASAGIPESAITVRSCNSCNSYIELWQAPDIHTVIHGEGIRGGTVSDETKGVGEDSIARYSLNYYQHLPVDSFPPVRQFRFAPQEKPVSGVSKDTIVIAVLDTGIDTTNVIWSQYLWRNKGERTGVADADGNCFENDRFGWNFINNSSNVQDDNPAMHGTLISKLIIREFENTSKNFVQIMSLKTHDHQGRGDLFTAICALHYAVDKGANIINASWGFYFYQDNTYPYLDSLITTGLQQKGILFVTAAGNKIDAVDAFAKQLYQEKHGVALPDSVLRNLEIHNFYPACLSRPDNNVIVATTSDHQRVSPTQNYSSRYVDIGVESDSSGADFMRFRVPFLHQPIYISGSSFATAVATGRIGATIAKSTLSASLNKQNILGSLSSGPGVIIHAAPLQSRKLVSKGNFMKK